MMRMWLAGLVLTGFTIEAHALPGDDGNKKPDFPEFEEVSKDYTKVVSTADGASSLYGIWVREKDGQMLAELPRDFANQKHFIALTVPSGETFAGLQRGDFYVYWKRFDKRVALISPNLSTRSTGDTESKDSVGDVYTDRVLVDVPIVCMGPNGQPVIDMDDLLVANASTFYGGGASMKQKLTTIAKAKAFPENVELAFEGPVKGGTIKTYHYSISRIPENPAYKPRTADERVGYFTTSFKDLGKFRRDQVWDRKINRWHLEKAAPKAALSPPKQPIVFYMEKTIPYEWRPYVRYRRFVKEGVLSWNKAFEEIGISDAIVVHYQDKTTGANMDKDPEDVRFNFIRWVSNDISTAIGPSRAHPITGEILDADIVLTDGWIRAFWYMANDALPEIAMEGFTAETLNWLDANPDWDPRVRLASPGERDALLAERARRELLGNEAYRLALGDSSVHQNEEVGHLAEDLGSHASLCMASNARSVSMAQMGLALNVMGLLEEEASEDEDRIDDIPEWFIGPSLADLVAHEVGHTLGLRHNFRASGIYTMEEINSEDWKGKKPFAGSVMDYLPVNAKFQDGKLMGDHAMIGVGPYDKWAIEYGYTLDDPAEVLKKVAHPELQYLTDEDTTGPDPLARRRDLGKDPLSFARNQMELVEMSRGKILDDFVKDGESWSRARYGYEITLRTQMSAVSMMANWLGGVSVRRDRKGDPDGRAPIEPVSAEAQRKALRFVVRNAFFDNAFGLTPELLEHMTVDKWWDEGGFGTIFSDPTWPIHDRISGVQASVLSMLMNPTVLRRVYDNEAMVASSEDALTMHEMLDTLAASVWQEVGYAGGRGGGIADASSSKGKSFSVREPMISSLRRNLQREHLERMIDLALDKGSSASSKTMSLLARTTLQDLGEHFNEALAAGPDAYTRAHLRDAQHRVEKALDASYSYNEGNSGGGGILRILIGQDE